MRARSAPGLPHCTRVIASLVVVLAGCAPRPGATASSPPAPELRRAIPGSADPRDVLDAHISHGIGESPFDSPLISDSLAARMIVGARRCASAGDLLQLSRDADRAGRLLDRLREDDILLERDGRLCTSFPVLIGAEREAYIRLTRDAARTIHAELAADLARLAHEVEQRGWKEWQYHFTWSQLFDSQFAWTELMRRGLVPLLGDLIAWVVHPAHPFRSGTNYYPDSELRDHWLMVSWRGGGAATVALVGGEWESLYAAAVHARDLTPEERERLGRLDLLDDAGVAVPVLRADDALIDTLRTLAGRYVTLLERLLPLDSLIVVTGADREATFAMAYHDVSWSIVEELVRSGTIRVPPALDPAAHADTGSMRGVAALVPVYAPFVDFIRQALTTR